MYRHLFEINSQRQFVHLPSDHPFHHGLEQYYSRNEGDGWTSAHICGIERQFKMCVPQAIINANKHLLLISGIPEQLELTQQLDLLNWIWQRSHNANGTQASADNGK